MSARLHACASTSRARPRRAPSSVGLGAPSSRPAAARSIDVSRAARLSRLASLADDDADEDGDDAKWETRSALDDAVERARTEVLIDTASDPLRELFSAEALRESAESGTRLERVVGAEFVPQAIIEAERKSSPLRRPRLVVYALSASAAAAQLVYVFLEPRSFESPWASALSDACVMVIGSLLWRVELQQRADNLRLIWEKAKEREASLTRAEAGLGDTIWTARMRSRKAKAEESREEEATEEADE